MAEGNKGRKCPNNFEICKLEDSIGKDWKEFLSEELEEVKDFLHEQEGNFYPPAKQIFAFTWLTKFKDIKVVIVGQDPYPGKEHAMGLCFSVPGTAFPPSLKNIFKELTRDPKIKDFKTPKSGDLTKWAKQGVLLLNAVLTTTPNESFSHSGIGWEPITNKIIKKISADRKNVVFMLWGNKAQEKKIIICNSENHKILTCSHPCPMSANRGDHPFIKCSHFSQANEYLAENEKEEIDWKL